MSREDPQFKLRMPASLREKAEAAAKNANRSLNAELVARLEISFLDSFASEELITAEKARELSRIAKEALPEKIKRLTATAINQAVRLGQSSTTVDVKEVGLGHGVNESETARLIEDLKSELTTAGYQVDWDGVSWLLIKF